VGIIQQVIIYQNKKEKSSTCVIIKIQSMKSIKKSFQKKHKKMKCQLRKVVAKILSGLNQLIIITKKRKEGIR